MYRFGKAQSFISALISNESIKYIIYTPGYAKLHKRMNILIINDDGIYSPGLWALAGELKNLAEILIVVPDREQSAIGSAITLHHPLRVQKVRPEIPGIETYSVGGTPADCAIMAISHLAKSKPDLLVSGINNGPNTGVDIFQSGTVGGALQGYLHGVSAIAVSIDEINSQHVDVAAKFTVVFIEEISEYIKNGLFLFNINVPGVPGDEIKGISMTSLSLNGLADTVEEGHDGRRQYFWLKYQKAKSTKNIYNNVSKSSDIWAVLQNFISITALHKFLFRRRFPALDGKLPAMLQDFKKRVTDK